MRSKVRAYSHQGHGPRADQQAGYISATSDSTPHLRTAAGPYIRVDGGPSFIVWKSAAVGRVGMWRGGVRSTMSVAAPFVWRCLSGSAITPFPYPAHRTQQA